MDITVTFRHMDPMESVRTYAQEKLSKMEKYFDFPVEAHVVLSIEKFRHQADVTLSLNGARLKSIEETGDMYSAIDLVMDKIEKQVKRHLSKVRDHRPDSSRNSEGPGTEVAEEAIEQEEPSIEVERLVAKPMDPEEAAMQLNFSNRGFLVFRNANSMEINVIYKRSDGNLGLIDPSTT